MEPYLRNQLGMPTSLKHGVVLLETSFTVATAGQALTPEQARILVHFRFVVVFFLTFSTEIT